MQAQLAEDPEAFLKRLASGAAIGAGAIGKKMAIAKLGPKLAPWLAKHGLALQDVLPVLELVDSMEDLAAALTDPEAFLARLAISCVGNARGGRSIASLTNAGHNVPCHNRVWCVHILLLRIVRL